MDRKAWLSWLAVLLVWGVMATIWPDGSAAAFALGGIWALWLADVLPGSGSPPAVESTEDDEAHWRDLTRIGGAVLDGRDAYANDEIVRLLDRELPWWRAER